MDLKVELHPIEKYIRNRSEMLSQVFQCVKGAQFRKMIPDILKVSHCKKTLIMDETIRVRSVDLIDSQNNYYVLGYSNR